MLTVHLVSTTRIFQGSVVLLLKTRRFWGELWTAAFQIWCCFVLWPKRLSLVISWYMK